MQLRLGIPVVKAPDPVSPRPMLLVALPSHATHQAIADRRVGHMCDDCERTPDASDFVEHPASPQKRPRGRADPAVDVVECQKPRHAPRLVVVEGAHIALQPPPAGLEPDASDGDAPTRPAMLNRFQPAVTHHDATTSPAADGQGVLFRIGSFADGEHVGSAESSKWGVRAD